MQRSGFTLIELSIVLVIIGLIVGGVLVGRDLIKAAEIRSAISDIEKFNTAVMTFRTKYNCLPGDCNHATQFWPEFSPNCSGFTGAIDGTTCNGDGDEKISNSPESGYFWQHLGLAGLVAGTYAGYMGWEGHYTTNISPVSKLNNQPYVVFYQPTAFQFLTGYANYYQLASMDDAGNSTSGFTPDESYSIDNKLDDGKPGTGKVRPYDNGPPCVTTNDPTTSVYDIADNGGVPSCNSLFITAPF